MKLDFDAYLDAMAHAVGAEGTLNVHREHNLPLSTFDGFQPYHPDDPNDQELILLSQSPADRPIWPMDVSFASYAFIDNGFQWTFDRVRTLPVKEYRGKLKLVTPIMYEHRLAVIRADGTGSSACDALAFSSGQLVDVLTGFHSRKKAEMRMAYLAVACAHGARLRQRYYWSVLLGENAGPRARFLTDIAGVREVFRLRDIPPGKQRRSALRHWVVDHWRRNRGQEDVAHLVREHLRGALEFTWNGLRCSIVPSDEDIERVERSKSR